MTYEYEYKVDCHPECLGPGPCGITKDPNHAGDQFRHARKLIGSDNKGGTVELYRRKLGPWELIEKYEIPRKEGIV